MGVAPVAGAASVSIPLRMCKGSCCTTFSQPPHMCKWQVASGHHIQPTIPLQQKAQLSISIFFSILLCFFLSDGRSGATRNLRVTKRQSAGHLPAVGVYCKSADGSFHDAGNTEGHHEKGDIKESQRRPPVPPTTMTGKPYLYVHSKSAS